MSAVSSRRLLEGSEALVESAIAADCKFFTGYPMTPFSEVLEHFARRLPEVGGTCINAESEIEAVNLAWGALAAGARAATGSTGQGLSLMQEAFSEITMAELPLVIFNMARGQSDYFQSTRGGGHGDYRHIVLAPMDVQEGVEHVQLAFHLADQWRNPVLIYGDYLIAHTWESVDVARLDLGDLPAKDWAVDGSLGGSGQARHVTPLGFRKLGMESPGMEGHFQAMSAKTKRIEAAEARFESGDTDDAEIVVVAFGTMARFVRYAVRQLRAEGHRIGWARPITLWPFPYEQLGEVCDGARQVVVIENSSGQMIDDVRLSVLGRAPVTFAGEISHDHSGFGVGALLNVDEVARRIRTALEAQEVPA